MDAHITEFFRDDIFVGYRYNEKAGVPAAFPFGFGLSYTTFAYSDASIVRQEDREHSETDAPGKWSRHCTDQVGKCDKRTVPVSHFRAAGCEDGISVQFTVENTGSAAGDEIVEVYLGKKHPGRQDPVKELAGFARAALRPGERKMVTVPVDPGMLEEWSDRRKCI